MDFFLQLNLLPPYLLLSQGGKHQVVFKKFCSTLLAKFYIQLVLLLSYIFLSGQRITERKLFCKGRKDVWKCLTLTAWEFNFDTQSSLSLRVFLLDI